MHPSLSQIQLTGEIQPNIVENSSERGYGNKFKVKLEKNKWSYKRQGGGGRERNGSQIQRVGVEKPKAVWKMDPDRVCYILVNSIQP